MPAPARAPVPAPVAGAAPSPRWITRLAWLVAFWIAGVSLMALVAVLLRSLMRWVGLAS